MRDCQTCIHSIPLFITSDIYVDGYSQICRDCKTKRKDGYEPIYDEVKKMTNFDKFMEVFGEEPDRDSCPVGCNLDSPCYKYCKGRGQGFYWWNIKYKENGNV